MGRFDVASLLDTLLGRADPQPDGQPPLASLPTALAGRVMTNPVGTETTQSMGMPRGPFDALMGLPPGGPPTMASDLDRAHGQLAQAMQMAPTMALGMVGDAPGGKPPGFIAYHGSPHSFDAFDASKIGTGEGAQAYGHGLYVAGSEGVARSYRDALAPGFTPTLNGQPFASLPEPMRNVAQWIRNTGAHPDEIAAIADQRAVKARADAKDLGLPELGDAMAGQHGDIANAARDLSKQGQWDIGSTPSGKMYEVQVNADPAHFLDWDKPLSEQTPHVQEAVRSIGILPDPAIESAAGHFGYSVDEFRSLPPDRQQTLIQQTPPSAASYRSDPTGSEILQKTHYSQYDPRSGAPSANLRRPEEILRDAGIPGIRYLDQGSRGKGEGSYNSVVFDADTMAILRKYGLAGLMAGGAAAATNSPQQQ